MALQFLVKVMVRCSARFLKLRNVQWRVTKISVTGTILEGNCFLSLINPVAVTDVRALFSGSL